MLLLIVPIPPLQQFLFLYLSSSVTLNICWQKWDAAEGLLYVCRKLLSQPYVAPVYAMLLYEWLLANKDAGGAEQRQKHVSLLVEGGTAPIFTMHVFLVSSKTPEEERPCT
jgi:hypothetical protein